MSEELKKKIQSKLSFKMEYVKERLAKETNCKDEDNIYNILYDVIMMILNHIHLNKVPERLETTLLEMCKDYYFLNGFDNANNSDSGESGGNIINDSQTVKSIQRLNEKIEFNEASNMTKINGRNYSTGTIEFDEDILLKKYRKRLNSFRNLRW